MRDYDYDYDRNAPEPPDSPDYETARERADEAVAGSVGALLADIEALQGEWRQAAMRALGWDDLDSEFESEQLASAANRLRELGG